MEEEQKHVDLEERIRHHHRRMEWHQAITVALRGYESEIFGYLCATMRRRVDAEEVYSMFLENLWRGIAGFRWESTFKCWAYTLARNAKCRFKKSPHQQLKNNLRISEISEVFKIPATMTDSSLSWQRPQLADRLIELRQQLDPEEEELLILRVHMKLAWKELAGVFSGSECLPRHELLREANRLKTRYNRLQDKMRKLAYEAGLVSEVTRKDKRRKN